MEERMAVTASARPYGERSATAIRVADRIRNRHEAKFFDVIAGKQAESRCIGNVRDRMKEIWNQDIIHIDTDLLVGRAHYRELREEIIVGRGGDTREGLQRTEGVIGEHHRRLLQLGARYRQIPHSRPTPGLATV